MSKQRHACAGSLPSGSCGPAIEDCCQDADGRFWVGNGEYTSQVAYCPYCGAEAPAKPGCSYHRERVYCTKQPGHDGDHHVPTKDEGGIPCNK